MNIWRFHDITHREHVLCNPISVEKIDELVSLVRLAPGARVIEIASGKGEFLIRLAERYGIQGIGVDISPYCIADARHKHQQRVPTAKLRFLEMDGADFVPEQPHSFDLAACIGASWVFGGHHGTLKALAGMATPQGWIVVGEPFWRQEPPEEYLAASGEQRSSFGTHAENVKAGQAQGLELVYTLVSSQDDWDRYEGLRWYAAEQWVRAHPDDADMASMLARVRRNKAAYLQWGRDVLGWAIYVFMKGALMTSANIYNYIYVSDTLITGGQPTAEQLEALAAEGFAHVVNLATFDPGRSLADEAERVRSLGMACTHIPVVWEKPQESDFAAFQRTMQQLLAGKTLIHCAANFRVTAFYSLYAQKHLGWSAAQAEAFRAQIWRGSDYPAWREFIARIQANMAATGEHDE